VHFADLTIHDFNGDGFSFQQTYDFVLEDIRSLDNENLGFHPGSGTERPVMRRLLGRGNKVNGLFFCVRVTNALVEDSEFCENGAAGVYFNRLDTDNTLCRLRIHDNGGAACYFRPLEAHSAAHRTRVLDSVLENNCAGEDEAEMEFHSAIEDAVVQGCTIRPREGKYAFHYAPEVVSVDLRDNQVEVPADRLAWDERP
jgi:hypothetical protein